MAGILETIKQRAANGSALSDSDKKLLEQSMAVFNTDIADQSIKGTPVQKESSFLDQLLGFAKNPTVLAGAANLAGGLGGYLASKDEYADAKKTIENASKLAGTTFDLGTSQQSLVSDDANLLKSRSDVLNKLIQQSQTGMSPEDINYLRMQQNKVNQDFQARQAQMQDNLQRRGVQANSGLALAQQMGNNQAALQQEAQFADQNAIRNQELRRQALSDVGNMSSSMIEKDFARGSARAEAVDKFNLKNIENKMQAAKQEAVALQNVANMQQNMGNRQAGLITDIGSAIGSGITANQQAQQPQAPAAPAAPAAPVAPKVTMPAVIQKPIQTVNKIKDTVKTAQNAWDTVSSLFPSNDTQKKST